MSKTTSSIAKARTEVWRSRVYSALRTTLACSIVGCTTLYGPVQLRRYFEFPSFTYATTVLIVSDATFGDTIRGCWHVLCASLHVMILSLLSLQVIGLEHFSYHVGALAMAASAFVVALSESTHLNTKRLAFGMLVNVYVSTVIDGLQVGLFYHPVNVVCSTALGAVAALLATFFPYPRFAYNETRKFYQFYAENTSERLNCNIEVISASDNTTACGFLTQAKFLSTIGARLLQSIRSKLNGIQWERPQTKFFNPTWLDSEEKLQDLEAPIRGMDIVLSSCTSFPVAVVDEELKDVLLNCIKQCTRKLEKQAKCFAPFDAKTASAMKKEILIKNLSIAHKDLPTSFFLYCVHLFLDDSHIAKKTGHVLEKVPKGGNSKWSSRKIREVVMSMIPSSKNLAFAFKSSLSLGLSVMFGLIYNKENAYWAGLMIALCFVNGRHPTFSLANARAQGTAMGSVYGILCCFIFKSSEDFIFLPLLPWIFFCSFLSHSRMYGQAGGVSAVTGALLVIGMRHDGPASEFALARIVEVTIGLICFVVVEILFNPFRAASLAKSEVSESLRMIQDCIDQIAIVTPGEKEMPSTSYRALREGQKKLKSLVCQLEDFTAEAELEPNFWFIPFHSACYSKMIKSLTRTVDLLLFVAYSMENIMQLAQKDNAFWIDFQDRVNDNVGILKNKVAPTLKFLEEITRIESIGELEKELKSRKLPCDIESQEYPNAGAFRILGGDEEINDITDSFMQHLEEITNKSYTNKDDEMLKGQMLFHFSCLGFCTSSLMRETTKIQSEVKELLVWENPSSQTNLKEVYCKINALHSQ